MTDPIDTHSTDRRPAKPRRRWLAGVALAGAFVAGGVTLPILAASAQDGAMHGMMGAGGHGGMHAMGMAHVDRMLDNIGASGDQKSRIRTILQAGFQPMGRLHAGMHDTHASLHALLAAPTIDRAALERLRAGEIAQLDQASRTMVQALADAAEVLRPDQRVKLAGMMQGAHSPS